MGLTGDDICNIIDYSIKGLVLIIIVIGIVYALFIKND